jgi:hypothetical protein
MRYPTDDRGQQHEAATSAGKPAALARLPDGGAVAIEIDSADLTVRVWSHLSLESALALDENSELERLMSTQWSV